ncbi:MAG: hypothetical protein IJD13_08535 [Oscillospiraceae bacterium]|nr:hypothetical protein [Oscillospiraceae bacterium]
MNKISCGICRDLIPLVMDEVAGEESKTAVTEHTRDCESCRALLKEYEPFPSPDDQKLLRNLRRYRIICMIYLMLMGALFGVSFSESQNIFYNILIMPAIGAVGVLAFGKKGLLSPLLPTALLFSQKLFAIMRGAAPDESLMTAFFWSLWYGGFCLAGALAMLLLRFAFGKEKKHEKE